jgi:DNA-binding transcriptional regulator YiaG
MTTALTATRLQLGQEIEALRKRAKMNTTQAAELIGVKRGTFRRYETGDAVPP